jgi:hypothetical protein
VVQPDPTFVAEDLVELLRDARVAYVRVDFDPIYLGACVRVRPRGDTAFGQRRDHDGWLVREQLAGYPECDRELFGSRLHETRLSVSFEFGEASFDCEARIVRRR